MAGIRKFDAEAVLSAAAAQFWRHGYEATSIQDLEAATGLGRGSLYNAFGDKAALFGAALAHYRHHHGGAPMRHLAAADARAGVAAMLAALVARMADPALPRGCLVTNSSLEDVAEPAVLEAVRAARAQMVEAMAATIARAADAGQLAAGAEPRALAHFYVAVAQSLAVMHKGGSDPAALSDIVAVAMQAWPAPAAT